MKEEIKAILGKHKVIGDTTYGLGYAEAEQLANEILATFVGLCERMKRIVELEEPVLRQYNSEKNGMGGYSSVPFYCSLCQMSEMNIQDNKLGVLENDDKHYACHCSVWDSPTGGKWIKWYDKEKAEQLTQELPCEDNFRNQTIIEIVDNINK